MISINNLPTYSNLNTNISFFKKIYFKILSTIFRPQQALFVLESIIILNLAKLFKKKFAPNFFLLGGKNYSSNNILENYRDTSEFIRINSWDYSYSLRSSKNLNLNKDYIVYISDGEARYPSDSYLAGSRRVENSKKLCKVLCNFFDKVENFYNCEIIIAAHPRSTDDLKYDKDLGNRACFKGYTKELIQNSKFVVNHGSTSISFFIC